MVEEANHTMDARRTARQEQQAPQSLIGGAIKPLVESQAALLRMWSDMFAVTARSYEQNTTMFLGMIDDLRQKMKS